jgi:hypothetical protein
MLELSNRIDQVGRFALRLSDISNVETSYLLTFINGPELPRPAFLIETSSSYASSHMTQPHYRLFNPYSISLKALCFLVD